MKRGEIYYADLNLSTGSEINKKRLTEKEVLFRT